MAIPLRRKIRAWLLVPISALVLLAWCNVERGRRVEAVSRTDAEGAVVDAHSPTGYARGQRWIVVPEHNDRSYEWMAETQQMLARHQWRLRHIDYENAPAGREVYSASPYRWWLGLVAWCDHISSGRPIGLSVERAALWADPLLHLFLVVITTLYLARKFGALAAAVGALGLVALYPLAGEFLPGTPDDQGLGHICAVGSVLQLLAAVFGANDSRRVSRSFVFAGIVGGLGLWIDAVAVVPVLVGIVLGGALAAAIGLRRQRIGQEEAATPLPWRSWGLAGATTCLAAYLLEYFPGHLEFHPEVNHPLYGLTWLGLGELLAQGEQAGAAPGRFWSWRRALTFAGAAILTLALPVGFALTHSGATLTRDVAASRLCWLPNGVVAENVLKWFYRDGWSGPLVATGLPLLTFVPAIWLLLRRSTGGGRRALALALGPAVLLTAYACWQLRWWGAADVALLLLAVAMLQTAQSRGTSARAGWVWAGAFGLVLLPGTIQLLPATTRGAHLEFTRLEVQGLVERELAHWLADHADRPGAVVLLPPARTTSWCFHGGLHGLGTTDWENRAGVAATVRIVNATTADAAYDLIREHHVEYIVLPSWDRDLDDFVRWTLSNPDDSFLQALHHWALPLWLRPVPYELPSGAGFEGQSVAIFQVGEESSRATSLSRLAEYFIEMKQPDMAASTETALRRYPSDLGALVALAEVEKIRGDEDGYARTFGSIQAAMGAGLDRGLPWDRRVNLAVLLAIGGKADLARAQAVRCYRDLDEPRIRTLTTASLYRLLVLGRNFGLTFPNERLHRLALELLPAELRQRVQAGAG